MVGVACHIQDVLIVVSDGRADIRSRVLIMDTTRTLKIVPHHHHAQPTHPTSCLWLPGLDDRGGGGGMGRSFYRTSHHDLAETDAVHTHHPQWPPLHRGLQLSSASRPVSSAIRVTHPVPSVISQLPTRLWGSEG